MSKVVCDVFLFGVQVYDFALAPTGARTSFLGEALLMAHSFYTVSFGSWLFDLLRAEQATVQTVIHAHIADTSNLPHSLRNRSDEKYGSEYVIATRF